MTRKPLRGRKRADRMLRLLEERSRAEKAMKAAVASFNTANELLKEYGRDVRPINPQRKMGVVYCELCGRRIRPEGTSAISEDQRHAAALTNSGSEELLVTVRVNGRDVVVAACSFKCRKEQLAKHEKELVCRIEETKRVKEATAVHRGLVEFLKTRRREASPSPQSP